MSVLDRNRLICELADDGVPYSDIAREFCITPKRVEGIVKTRWRLSGYADNPFFRAIEETAPEIGASEAFAEKVIHTLHKAGITSFDDVGRLSDGALMDVYGIGVIAHDLIRTAQREHGAQPCEDGRE